MNQFVEQKKRWYDDGHDDWEVLWRFKTLNTIEEDMYSWKWLVLRDDWHLWLLEQTEVSWMYNPKNWWSKFEFIDIWSIEDLQEYVNERFPWWFKLIDYLNEEFAEKFPDLDKDEMEDNCFTYQMWLDEVHICSKKDGHIKWLFENDRIDESKLLGLLKTKFKAWEEDEEHWTLDSFESLICYLSISDEPLKDLASVLK